MDHKFVYPIVRPLPRRGIDIAAERWPASQSLVVATARALGQRHSNAGAAGASLHAFAQPGQTPRMQVW
jgi:hypothetical protein